MFKPSRFYEREGLLSKPHRRLSGYREYPPEAVGLVSLARGRWGNQGNAQ